MWDALAERRQEFRSDGANSRPLVSLSAFRSCDDGCFRGGGGLMRVGHIKAMVWALADELNDAFGAHDIQPHQQDVIEQNMSLTNPVGERLCIRSLMKGCQISLGTKSLTRRMEPFMIDLTGRAPDGYTQANDRSPRWNGCDDSQVRKAAYFFADADDEVSIQFDIDELKRRVDLIPTERQALIKARRGQGSFRKGVLELWGGRCAVTGIAIESILIASHAKPWAKCSDDERLDPSNGLLLSATLDRLFDKHLIAFQPDTGEMLISEKIKKHDRVMLGIPVSLRENPTPQQAKYLRIHLEESELH